MSHGAPDAGPSGEGAGRGRSTAAAPAGGSGTMSVPPPPEAALRTGVLAVARRLEASGEVDDALELRRAVEAWGREQRDWMRELARRLGVHHEINNALVGVRGNVQLLLLGPAAQAPGAGERLEVVLRESDRIREAAARLNVLKAALMALVQEGDSASAGRAA